MQKMILSNNQTERKEIYSSLDCTLHCIRRVKNENFWRLCPKTSQQALQSLDQFTYLHKKIANSEKYKPRLTNSSSVKLADGRCVRCLSLPRTNGIGDVTTTYTPLRTLTHEDHTEAYSCLALHTKFEVSKVHFRRPPFISHILFPDQSVDIQKTSSEKKQTPTFDIKRVTTENPT